MKRKSFWRLRQQWKLLGLFEIDQEHEFHDLTCMLKAGLKAAVQDAIDNPPLVSVSGGPDHLPAGPAFPRGWRSRGCCRSPLWG